MQETSNHVTEFSHTDWLFVFAYVAFVWLLIIVITSRCYCNCFNLFIYL